MKNRKGTSRKFCAAAAAVFIIVMGMLPTIQPATASSPESGNQPMANKQAADKLNGTFRNIQYFLMGLGVALGGVMLVLAGTKWISSEGQPEERAKVKKWIMDIGIGLVLVLSSVVLVEIAKGLVVV